jgi:hypothetical protein
MTHVITEKIIFDIDNKIDFYKEINADSDDESITDNNDICLITYQPLQSDFVKLQCGHRFNYDAIFSDAFNQKKKFKSLEVHRLKDLQLRCPYCRNVQDELLPHYAGKPSIYGVNTNCNILMHDSFFNMKNPKEYPETYKYFAKGYCCYNISNISLLLDDPEMYLKCSDTMVKYNELDDKVYCKTHFKEVISKYFTTEIESIENEIKKEKESARDLSKTIKTLQREQAKCNNKVGGYSFTMKNLKEKKNEYLRSIKKNKLSPLCECQTFQMNQNAENVIVAVANNNNDDENVPPCVGELQEGSVKCVAHFISGKNVGKQCTSSPMKGSVYCGRHKNYVKQNK